MSGLLYDAELEETPFMSGKERVEWFHSASELACFDSPSVVAASSNQVFWFDLPGLYFLIAQGKVVYVGKASWIGRRLQQHIRARKPFDRIAVLAGLPEWSLDTFEYAYILAWSPALNIENSRGGEALRMPWLIEKLKCLDRSCVSVRDSAD